MSENKKRSAKRINPRQDEPGNKFNCNIAFRTDAKTAALWSSLRGICKKFGHDEKSPELFEKVVMPAMRKYVAQSGYLDQAKEHQEFAKLFK